MCQNLRTIGVTNHVWNPISNIYRTGTKFPRLRNCRPNHSYDSPSDISELTMTANPVLVDGGLRPQNQLKYRIMIIGELLLISRRQTINQFSQRVGLDNCYCNYLAICRYFSIKTFSVVVICRYFSIKTFSVVDKIYIFFLKSLII